MNKRHNKIIKSIVIALAIIMSIVVIVFGASKFISKQINNENALNYGEYRIQENEINFTNKNTGTELTDYTGEEVVVSINPGILDTVNKNKDDDKKMIVQYQLTELNDTNGVDENKWNDYNGPFSVDHNVRVNARLYSKADESFAGPVTNKDITKIAVAKIVNGSGNNAKMTYYRTLADAINAWPEESGNSSGTNETNDISTKIEMVANTKENVIMPQEKNIVLDVAGFKISSENETPTITINGKCNLINSKTGTISESIVSITNTGVKINSTGEFILGTNESESESNVSTTTPVIKGKIYGIQVEENGKFRFYDGKIIAPADEDETKFGHKAIYGTNPEKENSTTGNKDVYETPQKYIVNIEKDENGNEIATLAKTFVITFDADGGKTSITTKIVVGNKEYGELPVANKVGYEFVKWTYEEKTIEPYTIVTTLKDHTLKANYTPNTYKISFNANTASGKLADISATYDNETQLPTKSKIIMSYVKNGYSFKNWNTQPDGKGTSYEAGEIVKNLTQINNDVVILYAIWEDTIEPGNQVPTGISTTNTIKITCNQTDDGTGIDENSIQYAIGIDTNKNGTIEENEWSEWQNSDTFENLNSNTEYSIRTKVSDKAGNGPVISGIGNIKTKNIENAVLEVYKDNETSDQITPETDANNKSNPINTDLKLIVKLPKTDNSIKDDSTNGTSTIIYITGPDGDIKTYQNGNEEGIISNSDGILNINVTTKTGTYEIKITTTDGTNTVEDKYYVFIDKIAPTILPVKTSTTNSITVTANAGDEDSGVKSVTYILKDEQENIVETNLTGKFVNLKENTKYNVEIIVVDNAGNIGTTVVETATKSLEVGKLEFSGVISKQIIPALKSNPQTSDEKVWTNENVNVKITKPDDVTTTYIVSKNDEIASDVYSEDTQIATVDGDYVIKITTTDGTNTKIENYYFSVDKTAPVVVIEPNGKIQTIAVGNNQDNITVTLTVSDEENGSGVVSTKYAVSESNVNEPEDWADFVSGVSITQTKPGGVYYIWTNVVDKAGNRATSVKVSNAYNIGYAVEYDVNGGTGTITAQRKVKGTNLTLSSTVPTKDGYLFKGWASSKTATSAEYNARSVYSKDESVRLYAVWSEVVASTTIGSVTTNYDSIQSAIDAAGSNSGAVVTIIKNNVIEAVTVAAGQNLVIDTNGKTWSMNTSSNNIQNSGTLTIRGNGTITKVTDEESYSTITNKGILNIETVNIVSEKYKGIYNYAGGTVNVKGGKIQGYNSAIYNGGTVVVSGGEVESKNNAGISNDGTLTIDKGTITGYSYGIYQGGNGTVTVNGGTITAKTITGIRTYTGNVKVTGGTINAQGKYQDGIWTSKTGNIVVTGGTINGGDNGVVTTSTGNITITGGTINATVENAIRGNTGSTITIGNNQDAVSTTSPVIFSTQKGVVKNGSTFNFYDGIIKAPTGATITGTVTATPTGYSVVNGSETINNIEYQTAYLSNQYTVTFDTNGGNAVTPTSKTVTYGTTYGELPIPTKTGYTFTGWKLDGTDTIITSTTQVTTASAHTLIAQWKPQENIPFIVYHFLQNEEETGYDLLKTENLTGTADSIITLRNYSKQGEEELINGLIEKATTVENGEETETTTINPDGSTKIYLYYTRKTKTEYTITYDLDGGTIDGTNPTNYTIDSDEITLINPTKTGYTFAGWTGTGLSSASTKVVIAKRSIGNRTYKANWNVNNYNLNKVGVSENLIENGDFEDYEIIDNEVMGVINGVSHTWNGNLNGVPDDPTKSYYVTNWGTGLNKGVEVPEIGYHSHMRIIDGNNVFVLKTNEEYAGKTKADVVDGESVVDKTIPENRWLGVSQIIDGKKLQAGKLYTISMDIYRAEGGSHVTCGLHYGTNSDPQNSFKSGLGSMNSSQIGKWETFSYTFKLDEDYLDTINPRIYIYGYYANIPGKLYIDNVRLEEVTDDTKTSKEYNTTYTTEDLAIPTKTGYTFQGWYSNLSNTTSLTTTDIFNENNAYFPSITTPDSDAYIYAKWKTNSYTIKYNGNGATSGEMAPSTQLYDDTITLAQNTFTKTGHTFKGWSTTPDATTAQYTDKETVTKLVSEDNGEITLYAIWEANEYTVTYDYETNGGQVSETDTTKTTTAKIISGNPIDLKKTAYKQGYKFLGWSESPDSTNIVKLETMGNSDKTYYAIFGKLEIDTESINIDLSENNKNTINMTGENYGNLTYEIEDETVVSVSKNTENENAEITGLKNGTTKITIISSIKDIDENALKAEVTVTVVTSPTNIKITPKTSTIGVKSNNTVTISGEIEPVTANIKNKITYVSDNPEIATVDENTGVVKGVANGSVTITATTENGKSDVANVVVDGIAPEITITKNKYNQFTWTATDNSKIIGTSVKIGDSEPTTWTSRSDENITDVCVVENAGKYHVWAKDEYGNISNETIDAYSLTRSQGTNSSLVTKVDVDDGENAGNTGVDITDSITAVLPNTKIYALASGDIGYSISLKNGDTEIPVSGSVIDVNDNITITSIAKENSYNISYELNGGKSGSSAPVSAKFTDSVKISAPSRSGYEFTGWKSSENDGLESSATANSVAWDGSVVQGTSITFKSLAGMVNDGCVVKLTACWKPTGYDIIYELNGGTANKNNSPSSGTFNSGVTVSVPSKTGYKFMGWTSTPGDGLEEGAQSYNGSTYVDWDGSFSYVYNNSWSEFKNLVKQDEGERKTVKLTANWIPETYNITYDYKGGTAGKITQSSATLNEEVRISTPSKTGYTFKGWTSTQEDGLSSKALMYDSDKNYSSWDGSLSYTFTFNSYYSGSYFKNLAPQEIGQEEVKTVKLTANWAPSGYDIEYELNGGTSGTLAPTTGTFDSEVHITVPKRTGYKFMGWTSTTEDGLEEGAQEYNGSAYVSWDGSLSTLYNSSSLRSSFKNLIKPQQTEEERKTVKLTANWIPETYNITYDYKGGTAGKITQSSATLNEEVRISTPSKTGYTFKGWTSTQEDGLSSKALMYDSDKNYSSWDGSLSYTFTFNSYYSGSYFKNLAPQEIGQEEVKTVKLTANWAPSGYDIEYELNGGTSGTLAPTTGTFDSEVHITVPKRTGYKFMGWTSTTEDGLEEGAQEYNGSAYVSWDGSLSTLYNSSSLRSSFKNLIKPQQTEEERKTVKLTANWIPETYNITYDYKGGTAGKLTQSSAALDEAVRISNPSKTGYTFAGWTSTQEDGLNSKALMYDKNGDYTSWDGSLSYTFSFNSSYSGSYFKNLAPQEIGQEEIKTVKLTANWRPNGYDIVYELNGGTAGTLAPTTASFNTEFRIYNPTKSGYTFLGWTSSQEDGLEDGAQAAASSWSSWNGSLTKATYFKNLIAQHSTGERKAVKLTANWVPGTYNITYDYKGGTAGGITQSSAALDEVVRISKPSRTGYTFAGWTSSQEDGLNSKALMYDSSGNYSSWDGSLSYTFTFNSSYSGSYFKNLAPQEMGQEEIKTVKLTANWKPNGYDIIYELNGGTAGSSAPTTGSEGSNVSVSAPTKSGYTFAGWTSSKEDGLCEGAQVNIEGSGMASWNGSLKKVYVFKNLATQNIGEERKTVKLTANWKPNGYDIIYELNGGTAGSSAPTTGSEGSNVSVSAPTKSGYTFAGWTSSKEDGLCEGAQVNIEGSGMASWNGSLKKVYVFKNLATQNIGEERKTVKLTANWAPSGYDIEYELNGGTAGAVAPTSASFNTEFRIYNPTKSGCTFLGWTSSKEDGLEDGAQAAASSWSSWNGSLTKGTYFKNLIAQHSTGERKTVKLTANWQETSTQSLKTKMLKNQGLKNQVLKNQSSVTGNSVGGTENEEISSVEQTIVEQPASEETSTETPTETSTETPTEQTPVAQINETTYETLSEAINSSNNQDKITILKNLNIEEITIESDKNITINLNGKTITSTSINTINNKGTLTITGPGIIKNEIENGTVIYNTGTINIENNTQITATKNGGKGISCSVDGYINENSAENQKDKSGILNMKSGKITTEGIGSIGIYSIKSGTVNIIDGSIETTGFGGKAIYNNADLKINKIKILIDGDDSVGIYNSRNSKTCVLNNTEITIQKKEIENYEIIKNTNEFKAQLEEMKPSYGIYNDSNTDVTFETGVIKIERLKGIGIKNNFEGSVTLGKEDETINSASPIIYAICDNTTAIINNENGEIRFYDGKIVSVESVKKCFTNLLKNSEIVEETGNSNIVCYLKMCE